MPRPRRNPETPELDMNSPNISPTETLKQVLNMEPEASSPMQPTDVKRGRPRRVIQTAPPELTAVTERPLVSIQRSEPVAQYDAPKGNRAETPAAEYSDSAEQPERPERRSRFSRAERPERPQPSETHLQDSAPEPEPTGSFTAGSDEQPQRDRPMRDERRDRRGNHSNTQSNSASGASNNPRERDRPGHRMRPGPRDKQRRGNERPFMDLPDTENETDVVDGIPADGMLEIHVDGFGFLRKKATIASFDDVYVSQTHIKRYALRNGDNVKGIVRAPKETEKYFGLLRVDTINDLNVEMSKLRPNFDELTPIYPDSRIRLERDTKQVAMRFIDMIAPIGKGQRGIIVAPPKAGKTILLKQIANAITANHPDMTLIVLLIDERPEEVTDMKRSVKGDVIASPFDEQPEQHMKVADVAIERAKRLVEIGKDVVILLDSITRYSRASNLTVTPSGRTLQGGLDPAAIYRPKRFFGAARNIEHGGSLTIIATALVETGSRMDDIIFEEFKGTGNMELKLDRGLSEQRIYPAIDIKASGTRHDELLYPEVELKKIWQLHRVLANLGTKESTELLIDRIEKTPSNKDFLAMVGAKPSDATASKSTE